MIILFFAVALSDTFPKLSDNYVVTFVCCSPIRGERWCLSKDRKGEELTLAQGKGGGDG